MSNHRKSAPGARLLQRASRSLAGAATVLLAALLAGGLVGLALGLTRPATHTATAVLRLQSDGAALSDPLLSGGKVDSATESAFLSGEIARLSSDSTSTELARTTGKAPVKYQITQVGTSDRVAVSSTDVDESKAQKAVMSLIEHYQNERRASARTSLEATLKEVQRRIDDLRKAPPNESANAEITRLLSVQSSTQYALGHLGSLGAVDTPVYTNRPGGLSNKVLLPILLALLALVLAAALLSLARSTDRVLRAPKQLGARGVHVLFPVVAMDQPWIRRAALAPLLSQLPPSTERLLLIDADGRSGGDQIAAWLRETFPEIRAESLLVGQLDPEALPTQQLATIVVARLNASSVRRTEEVVRECTALPVPCAGVLLTVGDDAD